MSDAVKRYPAVGACGIDCGLCPRYYTAGSSRCPGCGAKDFYDVHPPCGVLSCAVEKGVEVCSLCEDYPCERYESPKVMQDSFVTHQKMLDNLAEIREGGLDSFLERQARRIKVLEFLLAHVDAGRSKSYYCVCCTLLPLGDLEAIADTIKGIDDLSKKELDKQARLLMEECAQRYGIELRLMK